MRGGPDSALPDAHHPRDLLIRQIQVKAQHQRLTLAVRQPPDRADHFIAFLGAELHRLGGHRRLLIGQDPAPHRPAPQHRTAAIQHRCPDVEHRAIGVLQAVPPPVKTTERLLYDILGTRQIIEHHVSQPDQAHSARPVQRRDSRLSTSRGTTLRSSRLRKIHNGPGTDVHTHKDARYVIPLLHHISRFHQSWRPARQRDPLSTRQPASAEHPESGRARPAQSAACRGGLCRSSTRGLRPDPGTPRCRRRRTSRGAGPACSPG
jgi:hypothetical protein